MNEPGRAIRPDPREATSAALNEAGALVPTAAEQARLDQAERDRELARDQAIARARAEAEAESARINGGA